jgi:hypothetical protein
MKAISARQFMTHSFVDGFDRHGRCREVSWRPCARAPRANPAASQEGVIDLWALGLAAMLPASDWSVFFAVSFTDRPRAGPAVDFPPMQAPASFNLESVKRQIDGALKENEGR